MKCHGSGRNHSPCELGCLPNAAASTATHLGNDLMVQPGKVGDQKIKFLGIQDTALTVAIGLHSFKWNN